MLRLKHIVGLLLFPTVSVAATIQLPAGSFMMGSDAGKPDERPVHEVDVKAFRLDRSPVSVSDFSKWLTKSGYTTEADKFGSSAVFSMKRGVWQLVPGANWQRPLGPNGPEALDNHPVTHVSWNDANHYCQSREGRLPTEAEFEYAAKGAGKHGNPTYAFGDREVKDGDFLVNVYNGEFPYRNTGEDGYLYTAPIGKTGITSLGFTDMAGNVWEWTDDWYGFYGQAPGQQEKALRGGSFLCDKDVCHGYRTTGRTHSTPDSSLMHTGFRCAYDVSTTESGA